MFRKLLALSVVFASVGFAVAAEPVSRKKPDVAFHSTAQDVVEKMLELAGVTKADHVCDLGCGDGRIVVTAAKKYGCRATGFEIDPKLIAEGRTKTRAEKLDERAEIVDQDLFTADLSRFTVVTTFLLPELNKRLLPQLEKMPAGSRIITHEFDLPGMKPDKVVEMKSQDDDSEHELFVYTVPLRAVPLNRAVPLKRIAPTDQAK